MLSAQPDITSDILSENGLHDMSIPPALSFRSSVATSAGRARPVKVRYGTSSPTAPDPWATTLAAIRQFFPARPDPEISGPAGTTRRFVTTETRSGCRVALARGAAPYPVNISAWATRSTGPKPAHGPNHSA
jgi:hypothetical protein